MPRPRNSVPLIRNHKGQSVIDVWRGQRRVQLVLGPWKSKQADTEYKRYLIEFAAGTFRHSAGDATLNELFDAFLKHADVHYRRPDGTPTSEIEAYESAIEIVIRAYGRELAREFGPLRLEAVRYAMIEKGWCRTRINQQVGRLRRVFKWAVSKEIIPADVLVGLQSLAGLQRGRTQAEEREPVKPVDEATINATLPFLTRHVAGMVRLQSLTAMRPGEVCLIRHSEIDISAAVWLYQPSYHKMAYRNEFRTIPLGPLAQSVLAEFPTDKLDDFIFSPLRSVEEVIATRKANRATPRYRSHMRHNAAKRKLKPKRKAGQLYTTQSYGRAIAKAVRLANERRTADEKEVEPIPHWHPNQLRHSAATRFRVQFGLEAAQVILGHKRADVTQIYAERNTALALKVAAVIG